MPGGEPASGQVTFRVPVDAFEPVLRELKGLGTYRGEKSSTEDVTNQYIDLNGQLAAWRAQERVYLRLLDRARSVTDVIAVQNQLQQVQSNIERLQGQLNYLEDQSSFSTIVLQPQRAGRGRAGGADRPAGQGMGDGRERPRGDGGGRPGRGGLADAAGGRGRAGPARAPGPAPPPPATGLEPPARLTAVRLGQGPALSGVR